MKKTHCWRILTSCVRKMLLTQNVGKQNTERVRDCRSKARWEVRSSTQFIRTRPIVCSEKKLTLDSWIVSVSVAALKAPTLPRSLIKPLSMPNSFIIGRLAVESIEVWDGSTSSSPFARKERHRLVSVIMVCSGSRAGASIMDVQQSTAKIAIKVRSFSRAVDLTDRSLIKCL